MYSEEYIQEVQKYDPIRAEQLRRGERIVHSPVWDENNLSEVATLRPSAAQALEDWVHAQ